MAAPAAAHVPMATKVSYGLGAVAFGVKDNSFGVFLLIFYNQVIGMPADLVGLAVMIALIADAFIDPVIGHLSDRTNTRWGRRHPWIYGAILPIAFSWFLIWNPPDWSHNALFFYLIGVTILVRTALSCNEVPVQAIVPELTGDYHERTAIIRYRSLFGWGGGLLMLFLAYGVFLVPTAEQPVGQLNRAGYQTYALAGAIMMAVTVLIAGLATHKQIAHRPISTPPSQPIGAELREIGSTLRNRAFLMLMAAGVFAFINQGIIFATTNYLLTYVWEFSAGAFLVYPIALFIGVLIAFFLVTPLSHRLGKKHAAALCAVLTMIIGFTPYLLRAIDLMPVNGSLANHIVLMTFVAIATGVGTGTMIIAQSMMSDVVEASQAQTGKRQEGLFFSGYLFMQKCISGFGIFLSGAILTLAGFPEKAQQGQVSQEILDRLLMITGGLIFCCAIISALVFLRFPFGKAEHDARLRELAQSS
jgi:glycoside/pentoside/hexuronide:cation symporter, GPH family